MWMAYPVLRISKCTIMNVLGDQRVNNFHRFVARMHKLSKYSKNTTNAKVSFIYTFYHPKSDANIT